MSDQNLNNSKNETNARKFFALIPLIFFLGLAGIFYKQLVNGGASRDLPSALLGKPAPVVELEPLIGLANSGVQIAALSGDIFTGKVSVLNVFASWCVPCRAEHPQLVNLAKSSEDNLNIQIVGLNYKDVPDNALKFLNELGNPYSIVGTDNTGRASIEWGVYGVPETYIIGPDGIIRFKHVGPISTSILEEKMKPLIADLSQN